MRTLLSVIIIVFVTTSKAQTPFAGNFQNNIYGSTFARSLNARDTGIQKKWFISKYAGITTGYSFFSHGSANFFAAPMGVQLNRRLNNNLYAFAGVTIAPTYINFNRAFLNTDINKAKTGGSFYQPGNFNLNSAATLGLMYINDERTFSISGSISVERNSYPLFYNNQLNSSRPNHTIQPYR